MYIPKMKEVGMVPTVIWLIKRVISEGTLNLGIQLYKEYVH
jgi:hypothetical protein